MSREDMNWKLHDTYSEDVGSNRILTRSQVAFYSIKNTASDLELFLDKDKHQLPGQQHLMVTMKGVYGAVPRTMMTRRQAEAIAVSEELCSAIDEYKNR